MNDEIVTEASPEPNKLVEALSTIADAILANDLESIRGSVHDLDSNPGTLAHQVRMGSLHSHVARACIGAVADVADDLRPGAQADVHESHAFAKPDDCVLTSGWGSIAPNVTRPGLIIGELSERHLRQQGDLGRIVSAAVGRAFQPATPFAEKPFL